MIGSGSAFSEVKSGLSFFEGILNTDWFKTDDVTCLGDHNPRVAQPEHPDQADPDPEHGGLVSQVHRRG